MFAVYRELFESRVDTFAQEELIEFVERLRKFAKEEMTMKSFLHMAQDQLKEAKKRAWEAKKELSLLKKKQKMKIALPPPPPPPPGMKSDEETIEGNIDQVLFQDSSSEEDDFEKLQLERENGRLRSEVRQLKKMNSDMNVRLIKILRVTRNAPQTSCSSYSSGQNDDNRRRSPPPPPPANFVISKSKVTHSVVDELKKKLEEMKKRKPEMFRSIQVEKRND